MDKEKQYWLDKPQNVRKLLRVFYAICAGLIIADWIIHRHIYHLWESLWGFYCLFGFVACVILVLAAREMRKVLMRDEDYYDHD